MKQVLVIANPAASRGGALRALEKVQRHIRQYQDCCNFDFMITVNPNHATDLAKAHAKDYDLVVAFGGDGTVNEVAQGLVGGNTPLAVIPFGTGNDYARSAGIPLGLDPALELACTGTYTPCDVGFVNGRYFVNAVGIGFDGRANYEAEQIRWLRGPMVILLAIFRTMWNWDAVPMTLTIDNQTISKSTYLIGIGNGPFIGGGLQLTPEARIDNGILHVCHVEDISPFKIIANFSKLKTGTIDKLSEVALYTGSTVVIESEQPMPVHVDGEVLGLDVHKLDLRILPSALQVIRNPV
ncbi:MAG: diacylglycerol kinase family lipid kinase [Fidelibacterota bacterium]|nr:MAG: diacylglycerol kinase family lipid kinase [Candidatus Neomarinimicrobiota bacterium]